MIDNKTQSRTKILACDAVPFSMRAVFYRDPNLFLFLPVHESETPKFRKAAEDALQQGASYLGSIALSNLTTEDGQAVIEYELMPGASEECMVRAKAKFRDALIEAGVLKVEAGARC
jgi:hypothetical protein